MEIFVAAHSCLIKHKALGERGNVSLAIDRRGNFQYPDKRSHKTEKLRLLRNFSLKLMKDVPNRFSLHDPIIITVVYTYKAR